MKTKKATFYFMGTGISIFLFLLLLLGSSKAHCQIPAFPGAEGFGVTSTTGGRGGQVIYVTNLNCTGPGSLNNALSIPGPKYILFTVSGIIDCGIEIIEGDCYIAGQTSPDGIIIRGIQGDDYYNPTYNPNNVIMRHMRSRGIGDHPCPTAFDPIVISGVENMVVDHCSFTNSEDEAADISRSSNITIQNCIFSETVGPHGYLGGMLMNYSAPGNTMDSISLHHNNWNRVGGRMPEFSCEDVTGCTGATFHFEYSCNLLWDQEIHVYHNIDTDLSNGSDAGFVEPYYLAGNIVNNYGVSRSGYCSPMFQTTFLQTPQNQLYTNGNQHDNYPLWSDYELFGCCSDFCLSAPNTDMGSANLLPSRHNYPGITYTSATALENYMLSYAGAFPRFPQEIRLMLSVQYDTIASAPTNINPSDDALSLPAFTNTPPLDSDQDGMPDYWENNHGLNPNVADPNATNLSMAITGINGYTNLECYLNCLADAIVNGSNPACQIPIGLENITNPLFNIYPNPTTDYVVIELTQETTDPLYVFDAMGKRVLMENCNGTKFQLDLKSLAAGMYYIKVGNYAKAIIKN